MFEEFIIYLDDVPTTVELWTYLKLGCLWLMCSCTWADVVWFPALYTYKGTH